MKHTQETPTPSRQMPDHVSSVDQKIFQEYQRTHPVTTAQVQGNILERATHWTVEQWRYNKKVFIPAVCAALLFIVVTPTALLLNSNATNQQVTSKGPQVVEGVYYAGDEIPRHEQNKTSDTTGGNEEGTTEDPLTDEALGDEIDYFPSDDESWSDEGEYYSDEAGEEDDFIETDSDMDFVYDDPNAPEEAPPASSPNPVTPPTQSNGRFPGVMSVVQANLYVKLSDQQFKADINDILSYSKRKNNGRDLDFLLLNEAHNRTMAQITPAGYAAWRSNASKGERETPVVFNNRSWSLISKGYKRLHTSDVNGGVRGINYVTLRNKQQPKYLVSVISWHQIHAPYASTVRLNLAKKGIQEVNKVVADLSQKGDVVVGCDCNMHIRDSTLRSPLSWLHRSGLYATYETLGKPAGWHTGKKGGKATIDYVFYLKQGSLKPVFHATIEGTNSDHKPVYAEFRSK